MINEYLYILFVVMVFPGLLFMVAIALFSEWFYRKVVARMQNRMGPAYTGPIGILQPLADILKLLLVKEVKKQRYSSLMLAEVGMSIAIASIVASVFMLPISPLRFSAPYDIIVLLYLYAVWHFIGLAIAVLAYPNPFVIAGLSRLIALTVVIEPAIFSSILVPAILTSTNCSPTYSVLCISANSWRLWLNSPLAFISMLLALLSIIIATQAKLGLKPFDIPEAEQELIAGHITEYSGSILALYNLLHDIKLAFSALLITYLFLGGPYPYRHLSIAGITLLVIKYVAVLYTLSLLRASFGRRRIDQGIVMIMKYSLMPSIAALLISLITLII
ncbi:MAG: complex I subunit 1 family protein [Ignisphaera sp.]|uniref:NADH-quinone oxidoreductase subunit H n=1 Tax=Ignisphaera aggregans TaxID=334771 RepID=A0A7J3MYY4_9CREN